MLQFCETNYLVLWNNYLVLPSRKCLPVENPSDALPLRPLMHPVEFRLCKVFGACHSPATTKIILQSYVFKPEMQLPAVVGETKQQFSKDLLRLLSL